MSLFAPQSSVREKCSCGATFTASGFAASHEASRWRTEHPCPNRKDPQGFWQYGLPRGDADA